MSKKRSYLIQGGDLDAERYSKQTEKQLKRSGLLVVKRKFAWFYSPDKLEQWLETLEASGLNLYRVRKPGTAFYFIKGKPRKVRYCVDYQNMADYSYYDIHKDAGWTCVYSTKPSLQKWTIWSREYGESDTFPQIYSDTVHRLKHARKIALTYSIIFFPLVLLYINNLWFSFNLSFQRETTKLDFYNLGIMALCISVFASFVIRTWLYYFRLRKQN